ncbi:cytochrome P450 [Pseudoneurospora amorphoporcata]|uniref:Cytochrome P450 n=1 Tax=Pseudoneurospora amorphoporcata TaxID=241081 RepID=A0AAN6NVQ3_9PEZI|nr:cytochrome P450 [Pseudoneurospora amorphoporcata]
MTLTELLPEYLTSSSLTHLLLIAIPPLLVLYTIYVAIYRLYLSPLASIPGPRLAALTQWYEFYYDIILPGQFVFKTVELHKKYGPIIRVNPWEVHISDPDFYREFLPAGTSSVVSTVPHELHKLRRSALVHFFSTASVRNLQPVIEDRVDALLARLREHGKRKKQTPIDMLHPFSALAYDIINEYAFAKAEHAVEHPTFRSDITGGLNTGVQYGKLFQHIPILLTTLERLPPKFLASISPAYSSFLSTCESITSQITEISQKLHSNKGDDLDLSHPTIFHSLLTSDALPPSEKTIPRIADEGRVLIEAGGLTIAWALTIATFHLLHQRDTTLRKLQAELRAAIPDASESTPLATLERLPYLKAVVKESFRLSLGSSSRITRVAPDEALRFSPSDICLQSYRDDPKEVVEKYKKEWVLPPGTEVSMTSYQISANEEVFPDAKAFRPERWLEGKELDRYLTSFGAGPRACLGMQLAYAEMYLVLAKTWRVWEAGEQVGATGEEKGAGEKEERGSQAVGKMRLAEGVTQRDAEMGVDWFIPAPYIGSQGVRVYLESY